MRVVTLFLLFFSTQLFGHEDTVVRQEGDALVGLPDHFNPAQFYRNDLILSLAGRSVAFPECVEGHFDSLSDDELVISASWYHDLRRLPPYISFRARGSMFPLFSMDMTKLTPLFDGFSVVEEACLSNFIESNEIGT